MRDTRTLRVVIVESSPASRAVLAEICRAAPAIRVVAEADDGPGGVNAIRDHRPDLVLLDLGLPGFDGFEVIGRVMAECPTPIVVVTGTLGGMNRREVFHALELGAVHVLEKPTRAESQSAAWREHFRQEVRFLARASVVRRMTPCPGLEGLEDLALARRDRPAPEVVVVVGSAGGAQAGRELLCAMPVLPIPLLLALHLGPHLHEPLVRFLAEVTGKRVVVADDSEALEAGTVYVAPGCRHIEFVDRARVRLFDHLQGAIYTPCHDHLLRSAASVHAAAAGVILTGLGSNGAEGLLFLRRRGGRTLAQTESSCLVPGMPRTAVALGAVERTLSPRDLGRAVGAWFGDR